MPLPWMSSVVTPGSIGGFGSWIGFFMPKTSARSLSTPCALLQSGSPTTGIRGSPASSGSERQFDTPGYGCEAGPGYQRSVICTGKDCVNGTKRPGNCGVPSATSFHVWSTSSEMSLAPNSACADSRGGEAGRSCPEWYDDRSGSEVPTLLCVMIVIAFDLRS